MNKIPSSDRDNQKLKTATNEVAFYIKDLILVLCPVHGDRLFQASLVLKQGLGIHLDGNSCALGVLASGGHENSKGGFRSGQSQVQHSAIRPQQEWLSLLLASSDNYGNVFSSLSSVVVYRNWLYYFVQSMQSLPFPSLLNIFQINLPKESFLALFCPCPIIYNSILLSLGKKCP